MKIAIMQPYIFPYLGYYSLISNTDHFVFFDTPQYIRKGWINRNRILSCNGQEVLITVPVEKCNRDTAIKDIKISRNEDWKDKWRGQLSVYKKKAPYYSEVMELVERIISYETSSISELAIHSIVTTCEYLEIPLNYDVFSQMGMENINNCDSDEWALKITKQMGYDTYVNPPGGKSFFDAQKYKDENIELKFLTQELKKYKQKNKEFIQGLSIIDVMMFCKPDEIKEMLKHYVLE